MTAMSSTRGHKEAITHTMDIPPVCRRDPDIPDGISLIKRWAASPLLLWLFLFHTRTTNGCLRWNDTRCSYWQRIWGYILDNRFHLFRSRDRRWWFFPLLLVLHLFHQRQVQSFKSIEEDWRVRFELDALGNAYYISSQSLCTLSNSQMCYQWLSKPIFLPMTSTSHSTAPGYAW